MSNKTSIDVMMDGIEWKAVEDAESGDSGLPYATHEGTLEIMGHMFRCVQLNTGVRLLDADDVEKFFGPGGPMDMSSFLE